MYCGTCKCTCKYKIYSKYSLMILSSDSFFTRECAMVGLLLASVMTVASWVRNWSVKVNAPSE